MGSAERTKGSLREIQNYRLGLGRDNILTESQGEERTATSVQARVIRHLQTQETYDVLFDDDSPGEAADIVAVRVLGGLNSPLR